MPQGRTASTYGRHGDPADLGASGVRHGHFARAPGTAGTDSSGREPDDGWTRAAEGQHPSGLMRGADGSFPGRAPENHWVNAVKEILENLRFRHDRWPEMI